MNGFESLADLLGRVVDILGPPVGGILASAIAILLAISGSAKIRHPISAALAMVDFGLVSRPLLVLGRLAGTVEVTIAAGLLVGVWRSAWATVASLLFAFFAVLIGRSLLLGRTFPCNCFGRSGALLSRWTLIRAVSLASLSFGLALKAGSSSLAARPFEIIGGVALLGIGFTLLQLRTMTEAQREPGGTVSHPAALPSSHQAPVSAAP